MPWSRCTLRKTRGQRGRLVHVEPRRGLVRHEQPGLAAQGPTQLHQPAMTEAERGHRARRPCSVRPTRSSTASTWASSSGWGLPLFNKSFHNAPSPRRARSATIMWSRTDSSGNTSTRWKVRLIPSLARMCAGMSSRTCPSNDTVPPLGRSCPHRQLNRVVFPAPLGPTRPTASPGVDRHRHVLQCRDPSEPDGDRPGVEQRRRARLAEATERPAPEPAPRRGPQPPNCFPKGMLTAGTAWYPSIEPWVPPTGGPDLRARRAS